MDLLHQLIEAFAKEAKREGFKSAHRSNRRRP